MTAGEELVFDYATCQDGTSEFCADNFDCACGTALCRGVVRPTDYALPDVRRRLSAYYPPWVKDALTALDAQSE